MFSAMKWFIIWLFISVIMDDLAFWYWIPGIDIGNKNISNNIQP